MVRFDHSRRTYPPPVRPWAFRMTWYDLLFAHWPLAPALLEGFIPAPLALDTFDGNAWLGIVPFGMRNVRPRCVPPIPGISSLWELNVRTYVTCNGKPGVWFFSLDANSMIAVRGARLYFHLPYFDARILMLNRSRAVQFDSERIHRHAPHASWGASYHPIGAAFTAPKGDLADWLTSRYCLYSANRTGQVFRGEIDHDPWPLQAAAAELNCNRMTDQIGISLPPEQPLLHFSKELHVVGWLPERVC